MNRKKLTETAQSSLFDKLVVYLDIDRSEFSKIVLLLSIFFLRGFVASFEITVSYTLFSTRVGPEQYSFVYGLQAIISIFTTLFMIKVVKPHRLGKKVMISYIVFAGLFVINYSLVMYLEKINSNSFWGFAYLQIASSVIHGAIDSMSWILASTLYPMQKAKQVFGYLGAGYTLGYLLASLSLIASNNLFNPIDFYIVSAVLYLVSAYIIHDMNRKYKLLLDPEIATIDESGKDVSTHEVWGYLKDSPFWFPIITITLLCYTFYSMSDFVFNITATYNYPKTNELIQFYAGYEILFSICTFIFSLFFCNKIINALGIWTTYISINAAYMVFFFMISITGMHIFINTGVKIFLGLFAEELFTIVLILVFKPAKFKFRNLVTSLSDRTATLGGLFLSCSIGMLLSFKILGFREFCLFIGTFAACATIYAIYARKYYINALTISIDEEGANVSNDLQEQFYRIDSSLALQILIDHLSSKDLELRKTSLQMGIKIDKIENVKYFIYLLQALDDPDDEIRIYAVRNLGKFKELGHLLQPYLEKKLTDSSLEVKLQALGILYELDPNTMLPQVEEQLKNWLEDPLWVHKILVIKAVGAMHLAQWRSIITPYINDPNPLIRKTTVLALADLIEPSDVNQIKQLINMLNDPNEEVAQALISTLSKIGVNYSELFIDLILDSIVVVWSRVVDIVLPWKMQELNHLLTNSAILNNFVIYENLFIIETLQSISTCKEIASVLIEKLSVNNRMIISVIFKILTVTIDSTLIGAIYRQIQNPDHNRRDEAIEMLQNLNERRITPLIINYFTHESQYDKKKFAQSKFKLERKTHHKLLNELLYDRDPFIVCCTLFMLAELGETSYIDSIEKISSLMSNNFTNEVAYYAVSKLKSEQSIKSTSRIKEDELFESLFHKIIFLQKTPLFSGSLGNLHIDQLANLAKALQLRIIPKNTHLPQESEVEKNLYFLVNGEVQLVFQRSDQSLQIIKNIGIGECFGEQILVNNEIQPLSFFAAQQTVLYCLAKSDLDDLLAFSTQLSICMINDLSLKLRYWQENKS